MSWGKIHTVIYSVLQCLGLPYGTPSPSLYWVEGSTAGDNSQLLQLSSHCKFVLSYIAADPTSSVVLPAACRRAAGGIVVAHRSVVV